MAGLHLYHKLNTALIILGPAALLSPSQQITFPLDLALGVIIPLHSHIGVQCACEAHLCYERRCMLACR